LVDAAEEGREAAVARETEHHAGVGGKGEEAGVVDACEVELEVVSVVSWVWWRIIHKSGWGER